MWSVGLKRELCEMVLVSTGRIWWKLGVWKGGRHRLDAAWRKCAEYARSPGCREWGIVKCEVQIWLTFSTIGRMPFSMIENCRSLKSLFLINFFSWGTFYDSFWLVVNGINSFHSLCMRPFQWRMRNLVLSISLWWLWTIHDCLRVLLDSTSRFHRTGTLRY